MKFANTNFHDRWLKATDFLLEFGKFKIVSRLVCKLKGHRGNLKLSRSVNRVVSFRFATFHTNYASFGTVMQYVK